MPSSYTAERILVRNPTPATTTPSVSASVSASAASSAKVVEHETSLEVIIEEIPKVVIKKLRRIRKAVPELSPSYKKDDIEKQQEEDEDDAASSSSSSGPPVSIEERYRLAVRLCEHLKIKIKDALKAVQITKNQYDEPKLSRNTVLRITRIAFPPLIGLNGKTK
jgi:hypothetical protein